MLTQEHAQTAEVFLEDAAREFADGDELQASEKMWGAVSHAISAVAMQRGQDCGTHRKMVNVAWEIANEQDDDALRAGISTAEKFHANFYHGFMEPEDMERNAEIVRRFVARRVCWRWRNERG